MKTPQEIWDTHMKPVIDEAVRNAKIETFRLCSQRCERELMKILNSKGNDPSWTKHLFDCSRDFDAKADQLEKEGKK